ncbi:MAG: hypothetical protein H6558_08200 [Lewinellaceae bacterium]|nr:hypothetical protein [Lewinellaceae bacterium]
MHSVKIIHEAASEEKIREIARLFIGDIVQIMVRENEEGVKYLENIKRAA